MNSGCKPAQSDVFRSLAAIVRAYRAYNQPAAYNEITFFEGMPSVESAIHHAGLAIDCRGNRFDHQRRVGQAALHAGEKALQNRRSKIQAAESFHELHDIVVAVCRKIEGLGELYAYDTALRLGAFLGLKPEYVYLHAGTREGARALGLDASRQYIEVGELPEAFRNVQAYELEDILCIYKDHLHG